MIKGKQTWLLSAISAQSPSCTSVVLEAVLLYKVLHLRSYATCYSFLFFFNLPYLMTFFSHFVNSNIFWTIFLNYFVTMKSLSKGDYQFWILLIKMNLKKKNLLRLIGKEIPQSPKLRVWLEKSKDRSVNFSCIRYSKECSNFWTGNILF